MYVCDKIIICNNDSQYDCDNCETSNGVNWKQSDGLISNTIL